MRSRHGLWFTWFTWFMWGMALLMACGAALAEPKSCPTTTTLAALPTGSVPPTTREALARVFNSDNCNSVLAVIQQMFNNQKVGGRKLEGDKPLDVPAAQQERAKALQDPEFNKDLGQALQGETLPVRRLVIEAALLHEYGHFKARDLLVQQALALPTLDTAGK